MVGFLWVYLIGEAWELPALAIGGMLPRERSTAVTYSLQHRWRVESRCRGFAVRPGCQCRGRGGDRTGADNSAIPPSSLIDTLILGQYVSADHGIELKDLV